jgi:hypothetical protein
MLPGDRRGGGRDDVEGDAASVEGFEHRVDVHAGDQLVGAWLEEAVEAALLGGLTATGVSLAAALPAVLAFRAVTFWLPAPLGWGAFVLLQRNGAI